MDNEFRIIRYNSSYKVELKNYLRKNNPNFSDAYIDYIVKNAESRIDDQNSLLVLNEEDHIVGVHMLYNIRAMIKGELLCTSWGHDTYLDENIRNVFGLDFVLKLNSGKGFGIGLSEVNRKIQKKLGATFWDNLYIYCYPTCSMPVSLLFNSYKVKALPEISVKKHLFVKCENSDDILTPEGGFWYLNKYDIDFERSKDYLNNRFFSNNVHDYHVYQLKGNYCYFVVRYVLFKRVPTLFVVDYRYDVNNKEQLKYIFLAAQKLANRSRLGMILLVSNDVYTEKLMSKKRFIQKKQIADFVATKKMGLTKEMTSFVTAADSDTDFLRR